MARGKQQRALAVALAACVTLGTAAAANAHEVGDEHEGAVATAEVAETIAAAGGSAAAAGDILNAPPPAGPPEPAPRIRPMWMPGPPAPPRLGASDEDRYALAGGCFSLRSKDGYVARADSGYTASAPAAEADAFRLQATDLGSYMLLGPDGSLMTAGPNGLEAAPRPTRAAIWNVAGGDAGFELVAQRAERALDLRADGALRLARGSAGADRLQFEPQAQCRAMPEIALNVSGAPRTSKPRYAQARGMIDLHSHLMAFEGFGRGLHCGRPWHPLGVASALVDCPDHAPNGLGGVAANLLVFQDPTHMHNPDGWPSFTGWPTYEWIFTHEQTYYRWIERAWRGGMRLVVMLAVDNSAACLINAHRTESCNEMEAVRRQLRAAKDLQRYVDAQAGGPGKGFFRIVRNPFQARRVINSGKLGVVLGVEVSEPLDCGVRDGVPQCDRADIDRELDAVHKAGVRQMEIANKFDNALSGVAMDGGFNGPVINSANKQVTGEFWDVETCTGKESDREQITSVPSAAAQLIALLPGGSLQLPVYPEPPHCNTRGLTDLGRYAVRGLAKRKMVFDPDHMSVLARDQALDVVGNLRYSGVVSSHSWADRTSYRRIMRLGGVVTPMASHAHNFDDRWRERREDYRRSKRARRFGFGFGIGDDMNGFGGPRIPTGGTSAEISYPFTSPIDRGVSLDRQRSGTRTFDINVDGMAHFGLWPDWTRGVSRDASRGLIRDLRGGVEAYLRMWERAVGIPWPRRLRRHHHVRRNRIGALRLGYSPKRLLRRAGQPHRRTRAWTWRVRRGKRARTSAVFTRGKRIGLVVSSARGHRDRMTRLRPGDPASALPPSARRLGNGLWARETAIGTRIFYVVRGGRVRALGVAKGPVARSGDRLQRMLRLARVG